MALKENSKRILNYVQEQTRAGNEVYNLSVATALGLTQKQVDGAFTAAICRKELGFREEGSVLDAEGNAKTVKFFKLTDKGMSVTGDEEDL